MDFRILGWLSAILALIATSPYWLRKLNSWTFKTKDKRFFAVLKFLRKAHKIAGLLLAAIAVYHGWLALNGRLRVHTGTLTYLSFLLTVLLGIAHFYTKDKRALKGHRVMVLVSVLMFALHLLKPWALGQWFGLW